jgi:hypothetical protein
MIPLVQLYWTRTILGIIAGLISAYVAFLLGNTSGITSFVNSFTIALVIYLASYYVLRPIFKNKIEKQSKILSTAIGMYFFTWLPFFVLFYTLMRIYF